MESVCSIEHRIGDRPTNLHKMKKLAQLWLKTGNTARLSINLGFILRYNCEVLVF